MAPEIDSRCAVLSSGHKMPLLGLGCWQSSPGAVANAVEVALQNGYHHIDTAYAYGNEEEIGRGIETWMRKYRGKREDIFVVTKLPPIGMSKEGVEKFLRLSLKKLNLPYVDLYLVHIPIGLKGKNDNDMFPMGSDGRIIIDAGTDLIAIWKEMERMVEIGLTKSIGVSNFSIKQLRKIKAISKIIPAVNQVEMNVLFRQQKLVEYCKANNIVITSYGTLGSPGRAGTPLVTDSEAVNKALNLLSNPVVKLIADKHEVTTAQVLIRAMIQNGIVSIPKSVNPERIKKNGDVFSFTLDATDVAALLLLDRGEAGSSYELIHLMPGIEDHPEFPL